MRKIAVLAAFAAAGVVASAGVARAQDAGTPPPRAGQRGPGGRFGRGGMGGGMDQMLLKGITLTDAQKTQLQQMQQAERSKMEQGGGRADFQAMRDARQKGDTATANRLMADMRAKMEARRQEQIGSIRTLLTDDQRKQFDANLAEMKSHQGARGGQHRPPPSN